MRRYELMLLLRPDLEDDKLQAAVEKVTRAIVNGGGSLSKVSPWGKRRLAYDIGHHREASYFLIHFDIEPSQIREIERGMLITEEILRHLVTVLEDRGMSDEELAPAASPREATDLSQPDAAAALGEDVATAPLDAEADADAADAGGEDADPVAMDDDDEPGLENAEAPSAETLDGEPAEPASDETPAETEQAAG